MHKKCRLNRFVTQLNLGAFLQQNKKHVKNILTMCYVTKILDEHDRYITSDS
jgi:hypothetical protein